MKWRLGTLQHSLKPETLAPAADSKPSSGLQEGFPLHIHKVRASIAAALSRINFYDDVEVDAALIVSVGLGVANDCSMMRVC